MRGTNAILKWPERLDSEPAATGLHLQQLVNLNLANTCGTDETHMQPSTASSSLGWLSQV